MNSNKNVNQQLGVLKNLINHARLVLRLMSDPRVPIYLKALPVVALVYLVWPIDFLPDFMPILGQLDDLAAVLVGIETFIALCPQEIVAQIRAELNGSAPFTGNADASAKQGETIDGQWKEKSESKE
ncbi:MAG: YkvA family protein [Chloroflexi bacterium]|nr:YkvA family protein [Chloroflexota bacterium]